METWLESVYSDGTQCFVSNPHPKFKEEVTVWIRFYENAPVKHIILRILRNGEEELIEASKSRIEDGMIYYGMTFRMTERRMQYQFYLVCSETVYFYTQKEITTYVPDHTCDFVLLTDYQQPEWVKGSVFYQIFPERFCNGNPENDVKSGEYQVDGHPTIHREHWDAKPLPYEEGYCLDFHGGDLEGIEEKIPYFKKLGVTALYINPIFLAPSVHKYDCIDYFHVDPHFGGDEALEHLSKALHKNGMKLILDISINHTGTEHRWFNKEARFFDASVGAYHNPDAKEREYYFFDSRTNEYLCWQNVRNLPTLNYTSASLRDAVYRAEDSVIKKWLKPPYSIDGWRFDVADVFGRNDELQLDHELWKELYHSIKTTNPQAYILAEDWGDCAEHLQGDEWDSPMNYYGFGRVIRQFLGEPDLFMARNEILRSIPYKMTAEDFKARIQEHLAKLPFVMWENQYNLFDSHDVPRLHNNEKIHPEEYRGAVIFLFTLIGTPSIYYGDEAMIDGDQVTFEGCRYPMPWNKDFEQEETFRLYQQLAKLKTNRLSLAKGGMKFLYAKNHIVAFARIYEKEVMVSILSVNNENQKIRLPIQSVGGQISSMRSDLFGEKIEYETIEDGSILLEVKAHHAYLMDCTPDVYKNN